MKLTEEQEAELAKRVAGIYIEIDNYRQTVEAIYAFAHIALWDGDTKRLRPDGFFAPGLPMMTSRTNRVSPDAEVTPDLVLGVVDDWGIVAEAKKSLSRDVSYWGEDLRNQLTKYDDDLQGWLDAKQPRASHGVTLLVHNSRKVDVRDYLAEEMTAGRFAPQRAFSIVVYHRVDELKKYISLETYEGQLASDTLDDDLKRPVEVPLGHLKTYELHFCDSPPPVPYTMAVIWDEVKPELAPVVSYQTSRAAATKLTARINSDTLAGLLQDRLAAGLPRTADRLRSFPKNDWIREALDALCRYGYGRRAKGSEYVMQFKHVSDPLETFAERYAREQLEKELKRQPKTVPQQPKQLRLVDVPPL